MFKRHRIGVLLASVAAACSLGSCASPTQIVVHIHTDMPCTAGRWQGIAVSVGKADASLEQKQPAQTSSQCDEHGNVGTLVLAPSGDKDAEVGLRVVAGLDLPPEQCADHGYKGCVVARRALRFDHHDTVNVDIQLARSCIDFGCNNAETCVDGVCKPLSAVPNDAPTLPDGGAGGNSGVAPGSGSVRCGDDGVTCPTSGNVCCVTIDRASGKSSGECRPSDSCPTSSSVLFCDDETDCRDKADAAGHPGLCLLSYTDVANATDSTSPEKINGSDCFPFSYLQEHWGYPKLALCNGRESCLNDEAPCETSGSVGSALPNYNWCAVSSGPPEPPADEVIPEGAPFVRCGDSGLRCPTTGKVCCLTVDRAAQTSTGACMPAAECPTTSTVLLCDDEADCADKTSPAGVPGVCYVVNEPGDVNIFKPKRISSTQCMSYQAFSDQHANGLGLCDRSTMCVNAFTCFESGGEPTNPLPNHYWCIISTLPSDASGGAPAQ